MAFVICSDCGERTPEGVQFCRVCGFFLEPPEAGSEPGVLQTSGTTVQDRQGVPAAGGGSTPVPVQPSAATAPGPVPAGPGDLAGPAPGRNEAPVGEAPVSAAPVSAAPVSAAPVSAAPVSAAPISAVPVSPGVHRPDEVRDRVRPVPVEDPDPAPPVQIHCPACGARNHPSRRICHDCGKSLAGAPGAAATSWWRRLLARLFGPREYRAGDRRAVAQPRRWGRGLVLLLVLVVAAGLCLVLPTRGLVVRLITEVKDRTSSHAPLTPTAARASSAAQGAGAEHVIDGASNQYWAPAGPAEGAWVEVDLPQPSRLLEVIVTTGVSPDKQQFLAQGRPHEVDVTVTDASGKVEQVGINLHDAPGGQTFKVKMDDAVRVRLTIKSAYGTGAGKVCALAELEIFVRG
jgi:hypothetical protein